MNGILDTGIGEAEGLDKLMEEINDWLQDIPLVRKLQERKTLREIPLNAMCYAESFFKC